MPKVRRQSLRRQDQDAPSIAKHRTSARITSKAKRNATSRKGVKTSKTSRAGRSQIDPDSDAELMKKAKIVFESDQEEETEEESHKETHNETESQQQQTQDKQGEDGAPVPSDEPQTQHVRNDVSMDMTSSHRSVVIHTPSGLDNAPSKMPLPKPRLPKRPLKPISPQKPSLCSPVQLRQRVLDVAASAMSKPLTNDDVTPTCSAYHEALSALSTSAVTELVGRETEQKRVRSFWDRHVTAKLPGSLYISGKPGTGKTATINKLVDSLGSCGDVTPACYINCMSLKDPFQIYTRVLHELTGDDTSKLKPKAAQKLVEQLFFGENKLPVVVLIVDEVDQLSTKDNTVLYNLFQWPQRPGSNVVLIGIANALDLTERILPLLHKWECEPETIMYAPYTKEQLVQIVTKRLSHVPESSTLLSPAALNLCAAKVTAVSGDVRQTLDLCRRTIEISQSDKRSHVSIMFSLFSSLLGSDTVCKVQMLPLHQKLLLISLYREKAAAKPVVFSELCAQYAHVCKQHDIPAISADLYSVLTHLACTGWVRLQDNCKEKRDVKAKLALAEEDIQAAFKSSVVLSKMLE